MLTKPLRTVGDGAARPDSTPLSPRQHQKRLAADEIHTAVAAYKRGATVAELAERFGCHRVTVARHLREAGARLRLDPLTSDEIDEAVRLYQAGLSLARVGEQVGATARTVQRRLRERGVQMRDTHGRTRTVSDGSSLRTAAKSSERTHHPKQHLVDGGTARSAATPSS